MNDPLELLLEIYFNAKDEFEKRKAEVKLMLQYPNAKFTYEDPHTKQKYKVIVKDKVIVIPYII